MQKIWEWATEKLTREEIKMKCYYALTWRKDRLVSCISSLPNKYKAENIGVG